MKKIVLLLFLCVSFFASSQIDYSAKRSVVVITSDTIRNAEVPDIALRMQNYYVETRLGQALVALGTIVTVSSLFIKPEINKPNVLPYIGGGLSSVGSIIIFDSYKFLNFKKKLKKRNPKKPIDDFY